MCIARFTVVATNQNCSESRAASWMRSLLFKSQTGQIWQSAEIVLLLQHLRKHSSYVAFVLSSSLNPNRRAVSCKKYDVKLCVNTQLQLGKTLQIIITRFVHCCFCVHAWLSGLGIDPHTFMHDCSTSLLLYNSVAYPCETILVKQSFYFSSGVVFHMTVSDGLWGQDWTEVCPSHKNWFLRKKWTLV